MAGYHGLELAEVAARDELSDSVRGCGERTSANPTQQTLSAGRLDEIE